MGIHSGLSRDAPPSPALLESRLKHTKEKATEERRKGYLLMCAPLAALLVMLKMDRKQKEEKYTALLGVRRLQPFINFQWALHL